MTPHQKVLTEEGTARYIYRIVASSQSYLTVPSCVLLIFPSHIMAKTQYALKPECVYSCTCAEKCAYAIGTKWCYGHPETLVVLTVLFSEGLGKSKGSSRIGYKESRLECKPWSAVNPIRP